MQFTRSDTDLQLVILQFVVACNKDLYSDDNNTYSNRPRRAVLVVLQQKAAIHIYGRN